MNISSIHCYLINHAKTLGLSCMILHSSCMDSFEGKIQMLNKFEKQYPTLHLLAL